MVNAYEMRCVWSKYAAHFLFMGYAESIIEFVTVSRASNCEMFEKGEEHCRNDI